MDKKLMLVLLAAAVAASAAFVLLDSDDSDSASGKDIRVYIQVPDGDPEGQYIEGSSAEYLEARVESASTVKNIYERAAASLGLEIKYDGLGNIVSVGGMTASGDRNAWNIHQWMPLGHPGWTTVAPTEKYDGWIISGATYCLHISESSPVGGESTFVVPDFEPVSDGYLYIRFVQCYDRVVGDFTMQDGTVVTDGLVEDAFTEDMRHEGFWLRGRGSTLGEVLKDAMDSNGFEIETTGKKVDGNGNILVDWVVSMFGLKGDENFGTNCYVYWSQFTYVDDSWSYNDYTLGYYDPGVYRYVACVLVVSIEGSLDTGGSLPDMSHEEVPDVQSIKHRVDFMDGGSVVGTQTVRYGRTVSFEDVPEVSAPAGKIFAGWGDIGGPITEETVFSASYADVSEGYLVRFFADSGKKALMHAEYVPDGESSDYGGTVSKGSTSSTDYTFSGWSPSPTGITSDTDAVPVFAESARKYSLTFIDYDGSVYDKKLVDYGQDLEDVPETPSRPDTVDMTYVCRGWSITLSGFEPADFSDVRSGRLVYAYYEGTVREYTVTVDLGGSIEVFSAKYGQSLGDSAYILSDGSAMKTYRDEARTEEFMSYSPVYGDTRLYGTVLPGEHVFASGNKVVLTYTEDSAGKIAVADGRAVVGDISQMSNGKALEIGRETLVLLNSVLGESTVLDIAVPQGTLSMKAEQLLMLLGGSSALSFSVEDTNTNQHNINKILKQIDYYGVYTPVLSADGVRITVLPEDARLTLPLVLGKNVPAETAVVWSLSDGGVPSLKQCIFSDGRASFELGPTKNDSVNGDYNFVNFVTGSIHSGTQDQDPADVLPYGGIEYRVVNEGGEDSAAVVSVSKSSDSGVLFLPSYLDGYRLSTVLPGAFYGVSGVRSLVLPYTVSSFDGDSLAAAGITDVYFLGGEAALSNTESVRVHVPSGSGWAGGHEVFEISEETVGGLGFEYYIVEDTAVFYRYLKGTEFTLPSRITAGGKEYPLSVIGDSAFKGAGISSILIPDTVTDIQTSAFEGSSLLELRFSPSGSAAAIWEGAFRGCEKLRNFDLPQGLEYIGAEAFRGCDTLTSVSVPDSCRVIGAGAFSLCIRLGTADLGAGLSAVPDACFSDCYLLSRADLPASAASIGKGAFERCYEMTSFDTASAGSVGERAFGACTSLESFVMGAGLRSVGPAAFSGCSSLKTVTAYCAQPEGLEDAFDSTEGVTFIVSNEFSSDWTIGHDKMRPDDSGEGGIPVTVAVAAGLAAIFLAAGVAVLRLKRKR
ncbi:MAG: hypothetical protein A3Q59_01580 [Methanomethylophilus alvi]|nr:MAG: hypothetical protein A3Q59_01580 [Methanomethylophilus alvi]